MRGGLEGRGALRGGGEAGCTWAWSGLVVESVL